jgi:serine-type D-Ala-D-Ala carboxypeptidase (penicillin-binding protein 5/6)
MRSTIDALLAALVILPLGAASGLADDSVAASIRHAYLMDATHDVVLLERNAQTPVPPASMSKIYTHLMLLERLGEARLSVDDTFPVSERAWRMKGSRSFLDLHSKVPVRDLMLGLAVQSGNDAAVVIAEGLFGTEELFASETNKRLSALGLKNTTIRNASGLPSEGHLTTVEDLGLAARHIIRNHGEHYWIFGVREFTWNKISQQNRNTLLGSYGIDGMKTGWTQEAGYGLIASAEQDGRRLIGVVAGAASPKERELAMAEMLNWGFAGFRVADPCVGFETTVAVGNGVVDQVSLRPRETCPVLAPAGSTAFTSRIEMGQFLQAPVLEGAVAGVLIVENDVGTVLRRELVATESVEELGFVGKLRRFVGL